MMISNDIFKILEKEVPLEKSLEWDNVGLIVGNRFGEVEKILITLDVTNGVIEEAIDLDVDLIISHHPIIFESLRKVNTDSLIGRKVMKLIENKIACYSLHTNYDVVCMPELLNQLFDIKEDLTEPLAELEEGKAFGKVGFLKKKKKLELLIDELKERVKTENVILYGNKDDVISKIAFSSGSGRGMVDSAIANDVDLLVSGDIDHHTAIDAMDEGIAIVDIGHMKSEHLMKYELEAILREKLDDVEIFCSNEENPYKIL